MGAPGNAAANRPGAAIAPQRGGAQAALAESGEAGATARPNPIQATLAQAQGLWNAGARQGAIDLLREAVASVVRTDPAGASVAAGLPALVRELARMELAQGQVAQALELLTRLEPLLAGQADLWAVRGNAAQRLGRHAESASAYQAALRLRPDEPRWMLGLAVSQAADGQTAAAAQWAERAREAAPVSPELLAYLRQMGVILRER